MASNGVVEIGKRYRDLKSRVEVLTEDLITLDDQIGKGNDDIDRMTKARWVITEAQRKTQVRFKETVESLVALAIKSCFRDRNFEFELVFEEKRNQMEVRPVIYEVIDGVREPYDDPEDDVHGGLIDVISIALRIVMWSLETPRSRPIIILDEPGKNMGSLIPLFGQILQEISHDLKFQLIIITHEDELIDIADRAYLVKRIGNESKVFLSKGEK